MTTIYVVPDSPPKPSGYKFSKSSPFHYSPQHSSPNGILADISHFEDIGLDEDYVEDHRHFAQDKFPIQPSQRVSPRVEPCTAFVATTTRNLTSSAGRREYPQLCRQVQGASEVMPSLSPPRPRSASSRVLSNPPTPLLQLRPSSLQLSKSPSPGVQPTPLSPPNPSHGTPMPPRPRLTTSRFITNSASQHQHRKTVQELEDEYHDSDEDLPEDATLWNVPISPRPPHNRPGGREFSPDRRSPGPRPIPLCHSTPALVLLSSPKASPSKSAGPVRFKVPSASSLGPPRTQPSPPFLRVNSWNLVMSELSEEAKILTEALEFHADASIQGRGENIQSVKSSIRSILELGHCESNGMIQLPPLQKSNIMIDPFPISKEKERFLSRTRPSWLPPKDPREEKKHLLEYKRMMALSREADKRKAAEAASALSSYKGTVVAWNNYTFSRCRLATGPGKRTCFDRDTKLKALERADHFQTRTGDNASEANKMMKECFAAIRRDVSSVFPNLRLFRHDGPLRESLINVLDAFSMYRNDVGYLYGVHQPVRTIAALFLLNLPTPAAAFHALANALNKQLPLAFLTADPGVTSRAYSFASTLLRLKYPRVSNHLYKNLSLSDEQIWGPMFQFLLTNVLDLERVSRVWDCWVFEGYRIIICAAVTILGCLEMTLLSILPGDGGQKTTTRILGWGSKSIDSEWTSIAVDSSDIDNINGDVSGTGNELTGYRMLNHVGDENVFMKLIRIVQRV
ncbi:hypothetical protein PAAG_08982 [Paracoccidioides lutzii Pb01]|uniref:Rab-GAP TBC domain-containing protein n=1 Tax=Paracoccidioides lutzii (strain ATCC MYA-826 / Pb01) TaxID=502779 RepID=C1HDY9_PARBA|nr:hypothetical protein PAAG_08982 [Paracoccidioides lutzii Pb01]EEH40133.1 hypothetical protein PAAG_08982 [Paracoccidioides lutzii Pb01]